MTYLDYLLDRGQSMQKELTTNIKYDKCDVMLLNVMWYILDTYLNGRFDHIDTKLTPKVHIKALLEGISRMLGNCSIQLEDRPHTVFHKVESKTCLILD